MCLPLRQITLSTLSFFLLSVGATFAQTTERVSVDSLGAQGNSWSSNSSISADGRYVGFSSYASNLISGDNNNMYGVFVHERLTDVTERVSEKY